MLDVHRLRLLGVEWGQVLAGAKGKGTFREEWQIAWQPLMMLTKQVRSLSWGVYNTFFCVSSSCCDKGAKKSRCCKR